MPLPMMRYTNWRPLPFSFISD